MTIAGLKLDLQRLPAPLPMWRAGVDAMPMARGGAHAWRSPAAGWSSLWGCDRSRGADTALAVCAAYAVKDGLVWLDLPLGDGQTAYPDLAGIFPFAGRMQRAMADLLGIAAQGAEDTRPWLNHGAWPEGYLPLRRDATAAVGSMSPRPAQDYAFVRVEGDGVHEIAVGPVHAGIIEPGHFRFSVVGEKVLRLEQRLGYTHKGIEQRFTRARAAGRPPARGTGFGRLDRGVRLGLLHGARIGGRLRACRNARNGCARCCWSASGWPTTWATSARWATTRPCRSGWPSSHACAKTGCACRNWPSVTA